MPVRRVKSSTGQTVLLEVQDPAVAAAAQADLIRDLRRRPPGRRIAISNHKGGSGKTTSTVNLAGALAERGKRVLVIDLDPQAQASTWLGVRDSGRGLLDVLEGNANVYDLVAPGNVAGVDVVPASAWLSGADKALAGEVGAETVFRERLKALPERWDFVLIDCPPSLGLLAISALAAASEVLVPVEAHVMALAGLPSLMQAVERVGERLNPGLAVSAILACRVNRTSHAREVVERLRERFPTQTLTAVIRESIRLAEAPSFHKPITAYAPNSTGAEDYRAAAAELIAKTSRR